MRSDTKAARLVNIDALRGIVMVVMALDHTRDFFSNTAVQFDPMDLARTTPALFLTRWITHFCAPVFVFLAGVGAALSLDRGRDPRSLAGFLVVRGLWLILLEVFVISPLGWSFRLDLSFTRLQVIWVIGMGMVVMGAMVRWASPRIFGLIGLGMICLHNLGDGVRTGWWAYLHQVSFFKVGNGMTFASLYPVIPWIGVMMLGYAAADFLRLKDVRRRKTLLWGGLGITIGFVVLRMSNLYGDPSQWSSQADSVRTAMSFLRVNKYPPSLLYLLMTLGPAILWLGWSENFRGKAMQSIARLGQVPLFFYLVHLPLLHGAAVLASYWTYGEASWLLRDQLTLRSAQVHLPAHYGYDLPIVYLVWMISLIALWPCCVWYGKFRKTRQEWIFRFL